MPRKPYRKTYVVKAGKSFLYKRAVPRDLQKIVGRESWTRSLGRLSESAAEIAARACAADHDKLVAYLRSLPDPERFALISNGGYEGLRRSAAVDEWHATQLRRIGDALDSVPESVYAGAAAHGLSRGDLAGAFMNTRKEAKEFEKRVALTRKVLRLETGTGLTSLVSVWQTTNKPRAPKSIDKMHLAVRYFIEAVGDMAPKDVTADHVGAFRDALERRQGMGSKTALKHLQGLNTLFNVAASERKFGITVNPCANITVRKSGGKLVDLGSKKPFQPAQIRTIFEKMSSESDEFQWMVRLLTYHGCRTSEAAQLRVDDVTESFGTTVLRMHDTHGRLKNRPSVREVPLHPACAGFIDYARGKPGPRAFSWPIWKSGDAGAKFSQLCSAFIRKKLGIADKALSAHSLRHTWITLAREIEMPDAVAETITGHTLGKGAHGRYGTVPLHKQAFWLEKINPLA